MQPKGEIEQVRVSIKRTYTVIFSADFEYSKALFYSSKRLHHRLSCAREI
jgi:hypothetical protein